MGLPSDFARNSNLTQQLPPQMIPATDTGLPSYNPFSSPIPSTTTSASDLVQDIVPSMPPSTAYQNPSATPMPSPSSSQPSQYFLSQSQQQYPPRILGSQPQGPLQQRIPPPHKPPPQQQEQTREETVRGGADDPSASTPFLRDLNLVAEAAKRAQMGILMRDMSEVAL